MRTSIAALLVCMVTSSAYGQADTYHTPLDADQPGGIVGTIVNAPGTLQRVIAVESFELKAYAANLEADTGRFELRGLPPGEYDLFIKSVGHVHEGLTLETGFGDEPAPDELQEMIEGVGETLYPSERYFDVKHIVRLTGDGDFARALVAFIRTRPTQRPDHSWHHGHVRRFALVVMERTRDVWQIDTVRHLFRQEVPEGADDLELSYTHSAELGAVLVGERVHDLGEIDLDALEPIPASRYASDRHREIWDD